MLNSLKKVKKLIIFVIGITIILFGIILLVLPGPGFLFIFLGLSVLAVEFVWARNLLDKVKNRIKRKEKIN